MIVYKAYILLALANYSHDLVQLREIHRNVNTDLFVEK